MNTLKNESSFSHRNLAIDMLRALTMFTMIFVNDFWKIHDVPQWMDHAAYGEDFMGLADIVFPCFLFAVGMSIPYSIESRYTKGYSAESTVGHILSRTLALLVMGAFITNSEFRLSPTAPYPIGVYWFIMAIGFIGLWNHYPKPKSSAQHQLILVCKWIGAIALLYLALTFRSPKENVFGAYWGILGTIGWTYFLGAMIYFFTRDRLRYLLPIWMLFILISMTSTPLRPEFGGEALLAFPKPNFYDSMLAILHIENGSLVSLTLGGMIISIYSIRYRARTSVWRLRNAFLLSVGFLIAGLIAHHFWIVAKLGATPTWVCYILSIATLAYALLRWLDDHQFTGWFRFIRPAGTATLTTYLIPYVFYGFADVTGIILPDWFTHGPLGLVNCICFAFVVIGVCAILEKMHIKLKI